MLLKLAHGISVSNFNRTYNVFVVQKSPENMVLGILSN
jgi:hypothetical protein